MSTLTILKKITKGAELVVLPRKEYVRLLNARIIPEYQATAREKKVLAQARKNRAAGKFLTLDELRQKLGFAD
ncbi:MAG: hypothetical protein A2679_02070 [Candidatus Sungbacteria bacterium RIFCSPHIGHO2_01_FULL_54_26]|uniref:Uncharacterized protein n=1 Tax=Candidatus Sungbacteria bacterium RIFCSPHIGHO2_02_FULL_53_17 TaxID=1802275 RepID=A0A1G2KYG5_9BACT|nr:MAG: hypothetical protein A2679_02070 [Candidatus Sungbacteria bacterium RIFCSPHIGHO2_01_FULL_54_26]OHA03521.1 MAG: hypothetical protein A3C92_03525 [Candidatus Sungbacteria bacterium RIFCSPHIGHO2_02_FULL_53_17]